MSQKQVKHADLLFSVVQVDLGVCDYTYIIFGFLYAQVEAIFFFAVATLSINYGRLA